MPAVPPPADNRHIHGATDLSLAVYEAMGLSDPTCPDHNKSNDTQRQTHKLDVLHPMPLLPNRLVHHRALAVMALRRVEVLSVTKSEGHRAKFSVDVHCRDAHSRIPVHGHYARSAHSPSCSTNSAEPDATVLVGYDDFMQLRHDAYEFARLSHEGDDRPCDFCRSVIELNSTSELRPRWSARLFKSDREMCEALAAYLRVLLALSTQVPASGLYLCRGQERVPRLLRRFLRSQEGDRQSF